MTTEHFNGLSEAEAERLAILAEECAEVIQVVGKILRHGYTSVSPKTPSMDNRNRLEEELGQVNHIMLRMINEGDVDYKELHRQETDKAETISKWLHHNV